MGRRGPKPLPLALRKLRGNPRGRTNYREPEPPAVKDELAQCPKWMTGDARVLWNRVAPGAIAIGLLTIVDLPLFEALCQTYKRWRQFERLSNDRKLNEAIAKGFRNAASKERQLLMQLSTRFGFDPSSRSNVHLERGQGQAASSTKVMEFRRQLNCDDVDYMAEFD